MNVTFLFSNDKRRTFRTTTLGMCTALFPVYNLVLPMLSRHPETVELDKVKVVHYCANVSILSLMFKLNRNTT